MKPIIEVDQVVKRYRLGQTHGLRQTIARAFRSNSDDTGQPPKTFNALNGVDFKVESGEVLGIIGTNGAGKSTLLKVLAGITKPTSGRMVARGRVAPLIEVGAGLIADLTGRENVYLNGVILGMSIKEIKRKFDDIVGFAELDMFIDTPIKRYSSGMAIRLGFAIATAVDSDILIVDEVLAVGDIAFQRKCFDRIEDIIKKQGKTILLVSHNIRQVERLCTRTLLLDRGRILLDGETRDVCRNFFERTNARVRDNANVAAAKNVDAAGVVKEKWPDVKLLGIDILDRQGHPTGMVPFRSDVVVEIRLRTSITMRNPVFGIGIHTSDMLYLATHHSDVRMSIDSVEAGEYAVRCKLGRLPLTPGVYSLRFGISEGAGATTIFYGENLVHFQITVAGSGEQVTANSEGFFALDADWGVPSPLVQSLELAAA